MADPVKPRKKDGLILFDLVVTEGNTPIIRVKGARMSALDEVLETIKKKL